MRGSGLLIAVVCAVAPVVAGSEPRLPNGPIPFQSPPAVAFAPSAPGATHSGGVPELPDDLWWWDGFALPHPDGWVSCAVLHRGSIVVGGRFTQIGGRDARNIARWDGFEWSPLGAGFEGDVLSLAVFQGELIASGRFDLSGEQEVRGIARWTGSEWAPLGGGLWFENALPPSGALALAASENALYAAGEFNRAGGIEAARVARWDGLEWSALGGGLDGPAQSLLVRGDSIYVGGSFHRAGGVEAPGVALWDGLEWKALGTGLAASTSYPYYPYVFDLIEYRGMLVATGFFDSAGSRPAFNIAAWNGSQWLALDDGLNQGIHYGGKALAVVRDTLVVGSYALQTWDGSHWGNPPAWASGTIECLLPTPSGLFVGGNYTGYDADGAIGAVCVGLQGNGAWDDLTDWTGRMNGLSAGGFVDVYALASYRGDVVASGYFDHARGPEGVVPLRGVARWNGAEWAPLGTPPFGHAACLLADGDTLYVGGTFDSHPGRSPVVRFDGDEWSPLDTLSLLVSSLALHRGSLFAGGSSLSGDVAIAGVHRWEGDRWSPIGIVGTGSITSLVEYRGLLVAGGTFDEIDGVPATGVAAWNGSTWSALPDGWSGVYSLVAWNGALYAGLDSWGIAKWDGAAWTRIPGPYVFAHAFANAGDRLFVAGSVRDPHVDRGVLRWDGASWSNLGSGTNAFTRTALVHDGRLYVGGRFTRAGNRSSWGVARWDLRPELRTAAMLASESGVPNPFSASTSIAYRLAAPGWVRVAVFDVRGRRVADLENAQRAAGTHTASWNGRAGDGRIAEPGIYFLRVELPGHSETRRVVRLR